MRRGVAVLSTVLRCQDPTSPPGFLLVAFWVGLGLAPAGRHSDGVLRLRRALARPVSESAACELNCPFGAPGIVLPWCSEPKFEHETVQC